MKLQNMMTGALVLLSTTASSFGALTMTELDTFNVSSFPGLEGTFVQDNNPEQLSNTSRIVATTSLSGVTVPIGPVEFSITVNNYVGTDPLIVQLLNPVMGLTVLSELSFTGDTLEFELIRDDPSNTNGFARGSFQLDEYSDFLLSFPGDSSGSLGNGNLSVAAIPEPSSALLLGLGALGFLVRRRRA